MSSWYRSSTNAVVDLIADALHTRPVRLSGKLVYRYAANRSTAPEGNFRVAMFTDNIGMH